MATNIGIDKMVLTVTINPLLERRLKYSSTLVQGENRNGRPELTAGGKGINVSRQLDKFAVENMAFTFLGGHEGKLLKDVLTKENIKFTSIQTNAATRYASVIVDETNGNTFTYFEVNSEITEKEVSLFKDKLQKMIQNCEVVVFSGSSPNEAAESIIPFGIECANKYDKLSVCDTYGNNLEECYKASPTVVHNNYEEIKSSLGYDLTDEKAAGEFLKKLYSYGVRQSFITNGAAPFIASNFDFHFLVTPPQAEVKDSTGSGDAFTAGVVYGLVNDLTFQQTLQFASAAGAINASNVDVCRVELEEIEKIKSKVIVETKGKKIKIIDDTPD